MTTKSLIHRTVLESNGYKYATDYSCGLPFDMQIMCLNCKTNNSHHLYLKTEHDFHYVCDECHCWVEISNK